MSRVDTCCFTGHRELPVGKISKIREKIEEEVRYLIRQNYKNFITGGAKGFDTQSAAEIIKLRTEFPELRLILALPCPEQADRWDKTDKALYAEIKARADEVVYISGEYHKGCMQKRNRYMVDSSSVCIAYMTRLSGGTVQTVRYCESRGVEVINLGNKIEWE